MYLRGTPIEIVFGLEAVVTMPDGMAVATRATSAQAAALHSRTAKRRGQIHVLPGNTNAARILNLGSAKSDSESLVPYQRLFKINIVGEYHIIYHIISHISALSVPTFPTGPYESRTLGGIEIYRAGLLEHKNSQIDRLRLTLLFLFHPFSTYNFILTVCKTWYSFEIFCFKRGNRSQQKRISSGVLAQ
jgi:hypothetical protein